MLNTEVKPQFMPILETGRGMTNANDSIFPHIKSLARNHLSVDVVFDVY